MFELILNCYFSLDYSSINNIYNEKSDDVCYYYESLNSINNRINAPGFNNSLYCGYSSIAGYYTTFSNNLFDFVNRVGIVNDKNLRIDDDYGSVIIDSILGIDYYVDSNFNIDKNENVLSIGFLIENHEAKYSNFIPLNQQSILNSMSGSNDVFF